MNQLHFDRQIYTTSRIAESSQFQGFSTQFKTDLKRRQKDDTISRSRHIHMHIQPQVLRIDNLIFHTGGLTSWTNCTRKFYRILLFGRYQCCFCEATEPIGRPISNLHEQRMKWYAIKYPQKRAHSGSRLGAFLAHDYKYSSRASIIYLPGWSATTEATTTWIITNILA